MRELSIFNRQRSKAYLFCVFCVFLIMLISGCGGGSDDSFYSGPSETGSAVFTVAWHGTPVILALENSLIAAQTEPVDCERVNNVICEVNDESDVLLTSASFACSDHQGIIYNIPSGTNRKFVILGEDVDGAILYHGEVSNITITAGQITNVGIIDTYFFVPTGVSATAISSSQINLSWNATDNIGVTGYNIYRNDFFLKPVTSTSTSDTGLSPSTQYCYNVSAYDATGNESDFSDVACQTTNPDEEPSTPTGLSAMVVSTSQINLSWNASTDDFGVTGYNIYRNDLFLKSVTSTSTSDTGLSPSTQYCYNVSAYDTAGNESGQSSQSCAITDTPTDTFPPTPDPMMWATPPYATSNSSITMVATTASDPSTPITYTFDFVNSPTGGSGGTDSDWQISTTYSNLVLETNHQFGYRVQARDSRSNTTDYSSTSYAYTLANMPGYPSGGPFSNVTYNSIRVTWTANGNPPWTEYYCENIDNETNSGWTTNTYWDSVDLACGTSYQFRVMARNGDGIVTSWTNLDNQLTQGCAGFDFDSTNEGWRMVGLYDDGGLDAIPDYFKDEPAMHTFADGSPGAGSIGLGSDGFMFPSSPTGDTFIHWDLNSPNLSSNVQWQDMRSFSYAITGYYIATSGKKIHVEAVLHVRKPDTTESYFSDFIFHEIPTESNGSWQTHTVDVSSLGMPPGTTILNINLRIFFEANSEHWGFVLVDHVFTTN